MNDISESNWKRENLKIDINKLQRKKLKYEQIWKIEWY